jgi:hypothetical protein
LKNEFGRLPNILQTLFCLKPHTRESALA